MQHYKALFTLGIPIVIGQIGVIILGFADTLMIGHHSTNELAAASFVNNMFTLAIIFATGFSYGLTPIVGSLFGRGETHVVGRMLKNSLFANTLLAVLLTLIMWILYLNIHRLGQPEELLPLMRPYFIVLLISLLFVLLFNGFKQFADGITDTRVSMWILLTGNVMNIIGNYILIYGKLGMPEMGLLGAGISTLASRIMMVIVFAVIFFCTRRYHIYKEGFLHNTLNRADFLHLNKLGWPIAMQMGMETASFSLSAIMVGWIGTTALAAHQVMLAISQICFMMYYGMGAAVAVRVSNFRGQNDRMNVRRSAYAGFHIMLGLTVFPDGIFDALDSTHIHSFPFVVMMGLRVATALVRLEVEDMALDHTGIPLDFDFPALLVLESILIAVLCKKQTHFIASAPVSTTRMENNKLNHPSGAVLKAFHGKNVMSFQLPC